MSPTRHHPRRFMRCLSVGLSTLGLYDVPGVTDLDDVAVLVGDSVAAFDLRAVHEPELDVVGQAVVPENRGSPGKAGDPHDIPAPPDSDDVTVRLGDSAAAAVRRAD